ncbi:MAG: flagellar filament capping protein FliD [Polyangiaceae bacterium]|nr:flagellar filament capping protein FliD [Polyangiaceae bacterium]
MPAAITFGGIGSGMDVEGIISGLVNVEKASLQPTQQKVADTRAAISSVGDISGLLSKLKTAAGALYDERSVSSFTATSSGAQVVATTTGVAQASTYNLEVTQLASEQRSYSTAYSSKVVGLNQTGSFNIQVGTGPAATINIDTADSLESITNKINSSGLRVSASIFNDGTNYSLLIRGLDSGAANNITFSESGTALGLQGVVPAQAAQNAIVKIDNIPVSSATNKIDGAIPGVSLALTAKTTAPITLRIDADPAATKAKVSAFVSAYNAVVDKVHNLAGFGTTKAQNAALAGDSGLRGTLSKLSSLATGAAGLGGTLDRLADVGVSIDRTGKLTLSDSKFDSALSSRPAEFVKLFAGGPGTTGMMDRFRSAIDDLTNPKTGLLSVRRTGLETRAKALEEHISRESARIARYTETLRKQFTEMDSAVAKNQALLKQIA